MLNNILKLEGAQALSKEDQKTISGGWPIGLGEGKCPSNPNLCITGSGFCLPCHL